MDPLRSVGERWFSEPSSFRADMGKYWGDWGVDSEWGRLRSVLMRRPGREIEGLTDAAAIRFRELPDAGKIRDQHDRLAALYAGHGVSVHYVEDMAGDRPNGMFCRDLCVMTPEGAIITRPGLALRRGEERYVAQALGRLGVPVAKTINGQGTFEGADLMWIDGRTALLGLGNRSNLEGCRQVEHELRGMGVEDVIYVPIPYGSAHLDGFINIPGPGKVVCFPWMTPYVVVDALKKRGFEILEVANVRELRTHMAINFVALDADVIVMAEGAPETTAMYRKAGIEVILVEADELMKGWGSVHCLTTFLRRDPVSGSG